MFDYRMLPRGLDVLKALPNVENTGCIAFFNFEKKKKNLIAKYIYPALRNCQLALR